MSAGAFGPGPARSRRAGPFVLGLLLNGLLVLSLPVLRFEVRAPSAAAATAVLIAPARPIPERHIRPNQPRTRPAHLLAPALRPPVLIAPPAIAAEPAIAELPRAFRNAPSPVAHVARPAAEPPAGGARPVVTGGFTSPPAPPTHPPPIGASAQLGLFSGPVAAVSRGAARPDVQAGSFGGFTGVPSGAPGNRDRRVIAGGFGAAGSATPPPMAARATPAGQSGLDAPVPPPRPRIVPARESAPRSVQILGKPKPRYTEEGRRLGIEGEVWLEALSGAVGTVHVQRDARSLGHRLDETAIQAAIGIRFRPASDGVTDVDQIATIRVQFLLAERTVIGITRYSPGEIRFRA